MSRHFPLAKLEDFIQRKRYLPAVKYWIKKQGVTVLVVRRGIDPAHDASYSTAAKNFYGPDSGLSDGDPNPPGDSDVSVENAQFDALIIVSANKFNPFDLLTPANQEERNIITLDPILPGDLLLYDIDHLGDPDGGTPDGLKVIEPLDTGSDSAIRRFRCIPIGNVSL
ncbi:MAG TPA: hypothetical protein ENI23_00685 [bacterium]|nr:hypothetical protein [bacterium]